MVSYITTLAKGATRRKSNRELVNTDFVVIDCADLMKNKFNRNSLISVLAASDKYAVLEVPDDCKILSVGVRTLTAEGATATLDVQITQRDASLTQIFQASASHNLNSIGTETYWNTGDYVVTPAYVSVIPSAELDTAKFIIDIQYIAYDFAISNTA